MNVFELGVHLTSDPKLIALGKIPVYDSESVEELANFYLNEIVNIEDMQGFLMVRKMRNEDNLKFFRDIFNKTKKVIYSQTTLGELVNDYRYVYVINVVNKVNYLKLKTIGISEQYSPKENEIKVFEVEQSKVLTDIYNFNCVRGFSSFLPSLEYRDNIKVGI